MKVKDIINVNKIPEDECDVCVVHETANKILPNELLCPKCNKPLTKGAMYLGSDFAVVGEANTINEDQFIGKYPIYHCNHDDIALYALMPIPIIYNGNHDIFYTGGSHFLTEDTNKLNEQVKEKILSSIEQYTNRIRKGENSLEPWNLLIWIQYAIEGTIAKFLYDNGYKK